MAGEQAGRVVRFRVYSTMAPRWELPEGYRLRTITGRRWNGRFRREWVVDVYAPDVETVTDAARRAFPQDRVLDALHESAGPSPSPGKSFVALFPGSAVWDDGDGVPATWANIPTAAGWGTVDRCGPRSPLPHSIADTGSDDPFRKFWDDSWGSG